MTDPFTTGADRLATTPEHLLAPTPAARLPYARWAALLALLLGELVVLTVLFDGETLGRDGGWATAWLSRAHELPNFAIAASAAAALFGGARLRAELRRRAGSDRPHRVWPALAAHLAAFALFALATRRIYGGGLAGAADGPGAWVAAWLASGLLVLACWGAAALRPGLWWPTVRSCGGAIATGIAVGAAAWALGRAPDGLWRPLGRSTLFLVRAVLRPICRDVVYRPDDFVVGTAAFPVEIAPQCSGYEGIGLIWAFLGAYLFLGRRGLRFPQALLLLPIGTAVIWLANVARIAALVAVGTWISEEVAVGGFHSQAGWLAFNAVALSLVFVSGRMPFFSKGAGGREAEGGENPAVAYLAPLLAIVAVTMVSGAFTSGFDWAYPLRVLAAGALLWHYRRPLAGLVRAPSWHAAWVGAATFAAWMALEPLAGTVGAAASISEGLARGPRAWAVAWLAFRVVGSVITVPIAEELAFRGYLIRRLISPDVEGVPPGRFTWASFLVSSALFGALHGRWLAGTLAGMAYALALYRRGRVADAVAAHATTNALIAGYVLATSDWSAWS